MVRTQKIIFDHKKKQKLYAIEMQINDELRLNFITDLIRSIQLSRVIRIAKHYFRGNILWKFNQSLLLLGKQWDEESLSSGGTGLIKWV